MLPPALAGDPQLRERFEREARAVSSLQHPHICALFDVGRGGDQDYLVLEYLEGETLADRIARAGALPPAEALKIGAEVCDALDKAHRSGIVHRDLKPANVMLTKAGAKLLDVGLAKRAAPVVASSGFSMLPTTPPNVTAQGTMARFRTWRRSRLRGSRPTRAPISLHSACCSRCHGADGVRRQDAREPAGRDPERRAAAHLGAAAAGAARARPDRGDMSGERSGRPLSERARSAA